MELNKFLFPCRPKPRFIAKCPDDLDKCIFPTCRVTEIPPNPEEGLGGRFVSLVFRDYDNPLRLVIPEKPNTAQIPENELRYRFVTVPRQPLGFIYDDPVLIFADNTTRTFIVTVTLTFTTPAPHNDTRTEFVLMNGDETIEYLNIIGRDQNGTTATVTGSSVIFFNQGDSIKWVFRLSESLLIIEPTPTLFSVISLLMIEI